MVVGHIYKKIKQKSGYYQSRFVGCSRLRHFLVLFMQFQKKTIEILVTNNNTSSLRAWQKGEHVLVLQKYKKEWMKYVNFLAPSLQRLNFKSSAKKRFQRILAYNKKLNLLIIKHFIFFTFLFINLMCIVLYFLMIL